MSGTGAAAAVAEARFAWLTGASDPSSRLLGGAHLALVVDLARRFGAVAVPSNLPYPQLGAPPCPGPDGAAVPTARAVPLPLASCRNTVHHLKARFGTRRTTAEAVHGLTRLLGCTRSRLVLLCGSTGWELLALALRAGPRPGAGGGPGVGPGASTGRRPGGPRVLALGLGPVGPARMPATDLDLTTHVVRGSTDLISRLAGPRRADTTVACGHLGYAAHPGTAQALHRAVEAWWSA